MNSGCRHAIEHIYFYLDEEISLVRASRIRLHLRHCPHCTDAFAFERRLKVVLSERSRAEPPPELFATLRALIQEERTRGESGM
jgi:mycothiol system anti-sigma-R factor